MKNQATTLPQQDPFYPNYDCFTDEETGETITLVRDSLGVPDESIPEETNDILNIPEYAIAQQTMSVRRPVVKSASLDWLSINFLQPMSGEVSETLCNEIVPKFFKERTTEIIKGNFQITPTGKYVGRVFKTGFDVYYHGACFASIQSEPFSHFIKSPDSITVKLRNEWLYCDWLPVVMEFIKTFNLKFDGISRADIALDGFNFMQPLQLANRKLIRVKNRIKVVPFSMGNGAIEGFYLGSRNSDRYLRGYHKNKEIEKSKKTYIREFWKLNGVKDYQFKHMERCEITMKAKELKKFKPDGLDLNFLQNMNDAEFLQSLAKSSMDDLYHFTELPVNAKQNVSRLKRVCEIVFEGLAMKLKRTVVRTASKIRCIQMAIKANYQLYLKSKIENFKVVAHELIHECELEDWFKRKKPKFIYEYELEKKNDRPFYPLYSSEPGKRLDLFTQPVLMRPFVGI